jgi:hypothetical protein
MTAINRYEQSSDDSLEGKRYQPEVNIANTENLFDEDDHHHLHRGLKARHSMASIKDIKSMILHEPIDETIDFETSIGRLFISTTLESGLYLSIIPLMNGQSIV